MEQEYKLAILGSFMLIVGLIINMVSSLQDFRIVTLFFVPIGLLILLFCIYKVQSHKGNLFDYLQRNNFLEITEIGEMNEIPNQVRNLIAKNETAGAISLLKNHLYEKNLLYNNICLISGKFAELKVKEMLGIYPDDKIIIEKTKINNSILQFLDLL